MSRAGKVAAFVAAFLTVSVWTWQHGRFNGANFLAIVVIAALIGVLWERERRCADCPDCRAHRDRMTDRDQHRGDGV